LYIRSFFHDRVGLSIEYHGAASEEESLVKVLQDIGPVIAIGKPEEKLPTAGAGRFYFEDYEWQDEICRLIDKSCYVFCRMGNTDGLEFELNYARKKLKPEQLILVVPSNKYLDYEGIRETYESKFDFTLPVTLESLLLVDTFSPPKYKSPGMIGFITFDKDWHGTFNWIRAFPFTRQQMWNIENLKSMQHYIRETLKPIIDPDGNVLKRKTKFNTATAILIWISCLSLGTLFLYIFLDQLLNQNPQKGEQSINGSITDEALFKGYEFYSSKKYEKALPYFQQSAEHGTVKAMNTLGWMYQEGIGVTKDFHEAIRWYKKAVNAGDGLGMTSLGWMYFKGLGVTQDYFEAIKLFKMAAEKGYGLGMSYIGHMYEYGFGVKKDFTEAVYWYRKAADTGEEFVLKRLKVLSKEP
jgi:hypothetical protein